MSKLLQSLVKSNKKTANPKKQLVGQPESDLAESVSRRLVCVPWLFLAELLFCWYFCYYYVCDTMAAGCGVSLSFTADSDCVCLFASQYVHMLCICMYVCLYVCMHARICNFVC